MNEYDGFAAVNDPREYLNAPAMMLDNGDLQVSNSRPTSPTRMPLIVKAAVDYAGDFDILSSDELQQYYAEQSTLDRRLVEVVNRLDVELKMREAAQSISKLHASEQAKNTNQGAPASRASFSSTRSSVLMSPKQGNRLSRMFGQDKPSKAEKRLSTQAAEEAAISDEKIRDLERHRAEIERRKFSVERTIMQHHCAVMSRALTNKPLPNHHQRSRSGMSNISSLSQNSNRQSWIVGPRHQRQWSSNSNDPSGSLTTVTEHNLENMHRTRPSPLEDELNSLVSRMAQILPHTSPSPQGKVSYVAKAFDSLYRDLLETRASLEAAQFQLKNSEERVRYLSDQHSAHQTQIRGLQSRDASGSTSIASFTTDRNADEAMLKQLKHDLELERAKVQQWRNHSEDQRRQLDTVSKSLEDVTRLAVQLEMEQADCKQVIERLESRISDLQGENTAFLQQKLKSTNNTSVLCQEFQKIISDLVKRHDHEIRTLTPMFPRHRQLSTTTSGPAAIGGADGGADHDGSQYYDGHAQSNTTGGSVAVANGRSNTAAGLTSGESDAESDTGRDIVEEPEGELDTRLGALQVSNSQLNLSSNLSLPTEKAKSAKTAKTTRRVPSPLADENSREYTPQNIDRYSFDDSNPYTEDSHVTQRPIFDRENTDVSLNSRTSSYYPESQINQSQLSVATGRRSEHNSKYNAIHFGEQSQHPQRYQHNFGSSPDDEIL